MRLPLFLGLLVSLFCHSAALYSAVARWGQAIVVIDDALFVYGGKTDPYNSYGYNSAPWNNDLLFLSLSTPFDPSAPPWQYVSGSQDTSISSQGTALAWHTLSAFNSSFCLIFGGSTGPLSSIVLLDNDDSAQLLNVHDHTAPTFLTLPNHWAGEPQRRMRHATASAHGRIYIIGGEAADGSGNAFSTHYIFDPSVPTFIQLPTQNSPPGIFGHAVIILFDGRLLVFGGISGGQLVPFSTIWVLDTTQSNLTWILASIDGSNLPSPRASFAVVLLDDGRILIQGGTDAAFQTNVADGWILDPSRNPMTWTAVPALSSVGPRRDHFAISAGGQVVFGFGYGENAPVDPAVQVYNVGSSSFQPTFSPATAPPAHTTLPPDPSQTITNPPGSSQTRANGSPSGHSGSGQTGPNGSRTGSQTGDWPSSTGTGGGKDGPGGPLGGSEKNKAAIAIGTVLGGLAFIAGVALVVWYMRRRPARSGHAFGPLGDNDDEEYPHSITALHVGGTREKGPRILAVPLGLLGMIGLGPSRRRMDHTRRDILADEDRSFDWVAVSREGSGGRSSLGSRSARSSIRGLSNAITERFTSIRNLARGTGSTSRSREPSTNWEKMGGDPFSPEVSLMAEGLARDELPERSRDGFGLSGPSQPYTDPFSDQDTSSEVLPVYDPEPVAEPNPPPERREHPRRPTPIHTTLPPPGDFVPLSPLIEQVSQNSLSNSSSSHANSDQYEGSGSSQGAARSPRPSSILDLNPPASQPIRRSNSWWMRFAKTPLLERRGTESSSRSAGGFIDFRDPNPPPRLLTIEEASHSRGPSDGTAEATQSRRKPSTGANRGHAGTLSRKLSVYHETMHGRSASSLQTANTETLERLGGTMDIVQRDGTLDSQHTPVTGLDDEFGVSAIGSGGSSSGSYPQPLRALLVRGEPSYHSRTEGSSVSESPIIHSPFESAAGSPTGEPTYPAPPSSPPSEGASAEHSGDGSPLSPGVAERVRAFERRMSRESALPPPPTNTRRREERLTPPPAALAATRPAVRYGLVPRPSLFVANPDGGRGRGSDGG